MLANSWWLQPQLEYLRAYLTAIEDACQPASGIHATIAGVILAMVIPATTRMNGPNFVSRARQLLDRFAGADRLDADPRTSSDRQAVLAELEDATEAIQAPLQRLERTLHPWVAYGIVPLFALANTGVSLGPNIGEAVGSPLAFGIVVGLVVGKQLGILAATWAVVRLGLGRLPDGVTATSGARAGSPASASRCRCSWPSWRSLTTERSMLPRWQSSAPR